MKVLLVAGILLSCGAWIDGYPKVFWKTHLFGDISFEPLIAEPTALNRLKRSKLDEDDQEKIVKKINNLRRLVAKKVQISNMQEVKYDEDLEVRGVCDEKEPPALVEKMEQFSMEMNETTYLELMNSVDEHDALSWFYPGQTSVACRHKICEFKTETICVCGPERRFNKNSMKKGNPGSQCDGRQDDGLCKAREPPTTVNLTTTTPKTKAMEKQDYDYEEDGSSNVFTTAIILNLIAFYLVASFL
ncbi:unnamed protein product [Caenorhabditis nigoni]